MTTTQTTWPAETTELLAEVKAKVEQLDALLEKLEQAAEARA